MLWIILYWSMLSGHRNIYVSSHAKFWLCKYNKELESEIIIPHCSDWVSNIRNNVRAISDIKKMLWGRWGCLDGILGFNKSVNRKWVRTVKYWPKGLINIPLVTGHFRPQKRGQRLEESQLVLFLVCHFVHSTSPQALSF